MGWVFCEVREGQWKWREILREWEKWGEGVDWGWIGRRRVVDRGLHWSRIMASRRTWDMGVGPEQRDRR